MLGFIGHGHDHEVDPARGELIAELHDRLHRIGLDARGVRAMFQLRRSEKWRPGDVIDIGPVEEPAVPAEIDLLVPGAEFAGQHRLHRRQQPLRNDRLGFERFLRGLDFRRARQEVAKIADAVRTSLICASDGSVFTDVEHREPATPARRAQLRAKLDVRERQRS